jgi:hypothetical protein
MPNGFYLGGADERKNLLCLLGRLRGWIDSMAKPKLKVEDEVRFTVLARAFYKCERCGGGPTAFGFSVHHRLPRGMGGSKNANLHQPANLITLCGSGVDGCHGWVESNRDEARAKGYLLYRIDNASEIPFIDIDGIAWLIDDSGQKTRFDTKWTNT